MATVEELVRVDGGAIRFGVRLRAQTLTHLTLTNVLGADVAYKVKTTAPARYCVRPNADVLPAGTAIDVEFVLQAFDAPPPDLADCRDKFLLLVAPVPPAHARTHAPTAALWRHIPPDSVRQAKFRVELDLLDPSPHRTHTPLDPYAGVDTETADGEDDANAEEDLTGLPDKPRAPPAPAPAPAPEAATLSTTPPDADTAAALSPLAPRTVANMDAVDHADAVREVETLASVAVVDSMSTIERVNSPPLPDVADPAPADVPVPYEHRAPPPAANASADAPAPAADASYDNAESPAAAPAVHEPTPAPSVPSESPEAVVEAPTTPPGMSTSPAAGDATTCEEPDARRQTRPVSPLSPRSAAALSQAPSVEERKAELERAFARSESVGSGGSGPHVIERSASVGMRVDAVEKKSIADAAAEAETEKRLAAIRAASSSRAAKAGSAAAGAAAAGAAAALPPLPPAPASNAGDPAAQSVAAKPPRDGVLDQTAGGDLYGTAVSTPDELTAAQIAKNRARVLSVRPAPAVSVPELSEEAAQRAAAERVAHLMEVLKEKDVEIERVRGELAEATHKLEDARMAVRPAYDVKYEVDENARIPIAQVAVMAAISGLVLKLLV